MPPPTWVQELAAIGDFLAGITLFLLVWIFIRDRRADDRAQVDRLAAWIKPDFSPLKRAAGQPLWVDIRALLRNASELPFEIVHVGVVIRPRWVVPDPLQNDKRVPAHKPFEDPATSTFVFGGIRLAPGDTHEQGHKLDLSDAAPAESLGLSFERGIACEFRSILVVDNAGRRWRLEPGRAGSAKRVRRGRKRKDEFEPHHW
jgi:hypothetical protein